jgi:hypothetical protein
MREQASLPNGPGLSIPQYIRTPYGPKNSMPLKTRDIVRLVSKAT